MRRKHRHRLNFNNRKQIERLLKDGRNTSQIAAVVGVDQSTISREIRRVTPYTAEEAQKNYEKTSSCISTEDRIKIITLFKVGKSMRFISRETNHCIETVRKILVKEKLWDK